MRPAQPGSPRRRRPLGARRSDPPVPSAVSLAAIRGATRADTDGSAGIIRPRMSRKVPARRPPERDRPPRSRRRIGAALVGVLSIGIAAGIAAAPAAAAGSARQTGPDDAEAPTGTSPEAEAREVAERWFRLANDLDGTPESRAAFLALYAEDALHLQGPAGDHQRGSAAYRGREKIAVLVERLLAAWDDHAFRPVVATARETSEAVWPLAPGPWGGPLVAAQFTVAGTRKTDGTRWTIPGAVFFRLREGRILRSRLFLGLGEAAEVEIQR